jgi:hypothetical protein
MAETEAGMVTFEQALLLLLIERPADLTKLVKAGVITEAGPGRFWLKDIVREYVKYQRDTARYVESGRLAQVFGVTTARISQLVNGGWFTAVARGTYDLAEACAGYIKFLRDDERRSTKSAADSRMRDAKAREIEIRTMQRLSRLVPLDAYDEMIDNISGIVRSEFAGLAAACTRDLTQRRMIEREVNARLRRIAEYAMAQAIRLEAGSGTADAVRANGAGPVGSSEPDVPADSGSTGTT